MAKKIKKNGKAEPTSMVGTRIPVWAREAYERQAEVERRKLSDVLRIVLIDNLQKRRAA